MTLNILKAETREMPSMEEALTLYNYPPMDQVNFWLDDFCKVEQSRLQIFTYHTRWLEPVVDKPDVLLEQNQTVRFCFRDPWMEQIFANMVIETEQLREESLKLSEGNRLLREEILENQKKAFAAPFWKKLKYAFGGKVPWEK